MGERRKERVLEALGVREMERERNVRNYVWVFYGVDHVIIVLLLKETIGESFCTDACLLNTSL